MSTRYCSSGPLLPHAWWGVPKEIPTLVCNGGEANREYCSMLRWDPRRKSVPPAQTLRAKHLLAYLPRPALDSAWYSSYLQQARTTEVMAATTEDREALCAFNKVVTSETTPPPPLPRPLSHHLDLCGSETAFGQSVLVAGQSRDVEEILEPLHSHHGGRYFRHLSSRWSPSPISGDHQPSIGKEIPLDISGCPDQRCESARRPRCKLIEEAPQLYTSAGCQRQRYVTKDGKCRVNLGRIEDKSRFLSDIFTTLVDMKYRWFLFVFTMCYIVTWVAFAIVYFLDAWLRGDVDHVQDPQWHPCFEKVDGFLSALLLSVESQRTIGYGFRMVTANCVEGVVLIMAQSIIGSIIDTLMVGCMFVKISRPQKRAQTLIFSKCCVISERDEKLCLLFRIGDLRESHMVDAKIRAKLIKSRETKEGEFIPLEQSEINLGYDTGGDRLFLVEPQTITHVINESSPFWEIGAESLRRERFEIIVILEGIVEASGMTCQARTSYTEDEIMWGHRFESCMSLEKEAFGVDYSVFHKTFEVQTSPLSAKERTGENATHF